MKMSFLIGWIVFANFVVGSAEGSPATPEAILPAGVDSTISINPYTGESGVARKGTVAATLKNIASLNQLLSQTENLEIRKELIEISDAIDQLIPSLQVIGLFDFFEPTYWIGEGEQPGRILVLSLYLKHNPKKYSSVLQERLSEVKEKITSPYLLEQIQSLQDGVQTI